MDAKIIEYAKKIAHYQKYPRLENGLQPVEDYTLDGKVYKGLETKYQTEMGELREAFINWQAKQGKTQWHVLHEVADVYYYCQQLESQSGQPLWSVVYAGIKHYLPFEWAQREVKAAAHAKYEYRSAAPGNKNEAHELQLIQQAVECLPERKGMGRPSLFRDSRSFEVKQLSGDLIEYVDQKREDQSRRAFVEIALREYMENHPLNELE